MITSVDFIIIGGGIAGLSAAARLSRRGSVVVLEREMGVGYHSSGRSATFLHLGIGSNLVRALTVASRRFFEVSSHDPEYPALARRHPAMFIARGNEREQLADLVRAMRGVSEHIEMIGPQEISTAVPVLRTGPDGYIRAAIDLGALALDSDAMLQSHVRDVRAAGGHVQTASEVLRVSRVDGKWIVDTPESSYAAQTLINAAGAWADRLAEQAGVSGLGLQPRRRTIIGFPPPPGADVRSWPFTKTVANDGFYMLPDVGRVLASPMDETASNPVDAVPEEYDVALAAWRVEQATNMSISKITTSWAGLRSFLPDENPAVGFDDAAPGFFWLVGQGGFGLQTSPALSLATEAIVCAQPWPDPLRAAGIDAGSLSPVRFRT